MSYAKKNTINLTKQRATLYLISEDGERRKLGHEIFHGENKKDEIRQYLMDRYWDERLTAASCSPDVEFEEVAAA